MVDFLFSKVGCNDTFTTKELKKYASSTKTCDTFMNSYTKWKNKVMEDGKKEKFFDNLKGKYVWGIIMLIIAILIDFVGSFTFHVDFSLLHLLIPLALIFLIYTCFIKRKSKKGIEHYAKWKAFKNFLNDFGSFSTKELPEVILWERYLVYATIFGLAKKVQKDMNVKIKEIDVSNMNNNTYIFINNYNFSSILNDSVNQAYNGAQRAITRESTSSSGGSFGGHGGGFSSGGGFGGGGRSGGGF